MAFEDGFGFDDDFFYDTGSGFSIPEFDFSSVDIGFGPGNFTPEISLDDIAGMDSSQFDRFFTPSFDFDIGFGPGNFTPEIAPEDISGMSPEQFDRFVDKISTDAEAQDGGFYGNTDTAYFNPKTNLTTLYDESGKLRDFVTHEGGEADIGGGSYDVESQPGGFYGNTPNATYDPKTNVTTIRDNDGNIIRTVQGPPIPGTTTSTTTTNVKDVINQFTGGKENTALLAALLGGLLGLLNKGQGKPAPAGYKGEIPKFRAERRPGQGTRLIQAADGGLMDLAQGGQAARYLRGGTDGMADKIKTSIDGKQPARLSHGEFVIPADVVSHLGNGNSDAGADVLYDMMAKIRKARTGTPKQGKQINPRKYLPA